MFDWFDDLDLDMNAAGVTFLIAVVWGWFLVTDPLDNMQNMPLFWRLLGLVVGIPVSYLFAVFLLNKD